MRISTLLHYALSFSALSCTSRVDARLEIVPNSHIPQPQFTLVSRLAPRRIHVERQEVGPADLRGQTMWTLMAAPDVKIALPTVLTYGEVLPGFTQTTPAAALFPGRYSLVVDFRQGRSSIDFDVDLAGRVTKPGFGSRSAGSLPRTVAGATVDVDASDYDATPVCRECARSTIGVDAGAAIVVRDGRPVRHRRAAS